jgi:hypothetical protein
MSVCLWSKHLSFLKFHRDLQWLQCNIYLKCIDTSYIPQTSRKSPHHRTCPVKFGPVRHDFLCYRTKCPTKIKTAKSLKKNKLRILDAVLVRSWSNGNKWVYPNAILYVFVIMTICTSAVSCIHFAHFVLFGTLQSKWHLILCVICFGPTEFVSVRQIFTSCLAECPTLF